MGSIPETVTNTTEDPKAGLCLAFPERYICERDLVTPKRGFSQKVNFAPESNLRRVMIIN
jgi:hypothetical protein